MPYELRIAAVGHSAEDIHDVTFQAWQHDLGLGIAETGVEFDDLDPLRGLHQASVKHAFERQPSATIASAVGCNTFSSA